MEEQTIPLQREEWRSPEVRRLVSGSAEFGGSAGPDGSGNS